MREDSTGPVALQGPQRRLEDDLDVGIYNLVCTGKVHKWSASLHVCQLHACMMAHENKGPRGHYDGELAARKLRGRPGDGRVYVHVKWPLRGARPLNQRH